MIYYLLQVSVLLGMFIYIYKLFLSNKTTYKFNRFYLLITFLGSIFIPIIPFNKIYLTFAQNPISYINDIYVLDDLIIDLNVKNQHFNSIIYTLLIIVFLIGSLYFIFRFIKELVFIRNVFIKSEKTNYKGIKVCIIDKRNEIFSFGKTLFIDSLIYENIESNKEIWLHEKAHIKQLHTIDILIVEFSKIFFWFIPFIYKYLECIKNNHEYLADDEVIKQTKNINAYQNHLLKYINNQQCVFVSTFNFKLTKKRFIMMKSKTNLTVQIITKINILFVVALIFTFTACSKKEMADENQSVESQESFNDQAKNKLTESDSDEIQKIVEQKAEPLNGMQEFRKEFANKFDASKISVTDSQIKTVLNFVVEKNGTISNIKVLNSSSEEAANEAIRVLKTMPDWKPGMNQGVVVRSSFTLPIVIAL